MSIETLIHYICNKPKNIGTLGSIAIKESGDLRIVNYINVFDLNKYEEISRGLIVNYKTGEIVARPYDKFYNWGERGRKTSAHIQTIMEKMDGSLGILYRKDDGYAVATRGSFDSDQAIWATDFLKNFNLDNLPIEYTLLFEIIYPENRIVLDYQGLEDLVLTGVRNRFTGEYLPFYGDVSVYQVAKDYGFSLPKTYNFNDVISIIETCGAEFDTEGYVVLFADGQRFKFKTDDYLTKHKIYSRYSKKLVVENILKTKETLDKFLVGYPEEFHEEIIGLWKECQIAISTTNDIVLEFANQHLSTPRNKLYQFVPKELSNLIYAYVDNKNYEDVLKSYVLNFMIGQL